MLRALDSLIGHVAGVGQWLALPLILLLFLQWPLRDLVHGYSRDANDLAQWIFAIYVAISVTAATRAGTHLSADIVAQRYAPRTRARLARGIMIAAIAPWALFVLFASRSIVLSSVAALETFPDTYNPGYFLVKLALWLLAILMLAQSIVDATRPLPRS